MNLKSIIGLVFFLAGAAVFFAGGTGQYTAVSLMISGTETVGEIKEMRQSMRSAGGSGPAYKPIYRFKDASGKEWVGAHRFYSGFVYYENGEAVPILYASDDPKKSIMNTAYGRYSHLVIVLFSLPFLLLGGWLIRKGVREDRELGWRA
jgi:hypothetical protein